MTEAADALPVAVVGAGPVGLIAALGLAHHGVPVVVFEDDTSLSLDTKAGTVLTRTLEVLHRYGALDPVLAAALRVDGIGDFDRASGTARSSVRLGELTGDTRFPFVINIPQDSLEPLLAESLERVAPGALRLGHSFTGFEQHDDHVSVSLRTAEGERVFSASHLLGCDGGRSRVRDELGVAVEGATLEERYMLVDVATDGADPEQHRFGHLAYLGDPQEWAIVVRQPHCWRYLFPLPAGTPEPGTEELGVKVREFIGGSGPLAVIGTNVYSVHQRVARRWREGRVFLLGDAAHLITPMWALGLNTGVLDASNLPWRLAWVRRGWADESLLDGYEREQAPVAIHGSGAMAEAARAYMSRREDTDPAMSDGNWGNAFTRGLLGVRLDVDDTGDWSMIKQGHEPSAVRVGDRAPDLPLFGADGTHYLHDLCADSFIALVFTDTRARPRLPRDDSPALRRFAVSHWDVPQDSGLREESLLDPGERVRRRFGVEEDTLVLLRPDAHVAAIVPFDPAGDGDPAGEIYAAITGRAAPHDNETEEVASHGSR